MTPKDVSKETDLYLNHVSTVLGELTRMGLVELLTGDLRKGRIYAVTKKGQILVAQLVEGNDSEDGD